MSDRKATMQEDFEVLVSNLIEVYCAQGREAIDVIDSLRDVLRKKSLQYDSSAMPQVLAVKTVH